MGIIDINVQKPAFRRIVGREEPMGETAPTEPEKPASTGRIRTLLKTAGALTIGVLGMVTVRKLRRRHPGESTSEE